LSPFYAPDLSTLFNEFSLDSHDEIPNQKHAHGEVGKGEESQGQEQAVKIGEGIAERKRRERREKDPNGITLSG
jgi:hypothetical protein